MTFIDAIFYPTKALALLVLPPTGFLLLALLALALLRRWPRAARTTLWLSLLSLLVCAMPLTARLCTALLDAPPLDPAAGKQAQAIVILGGGLYRDTPEHGDMLSDRSLARTRYGAELTKQFHLPILVTGGRVYGGAAEADIMAAALTRDFGITAKWIEPRSRYTAENMRFSAALLQQDHVRKVIVVTDDLHMRRALAHCAASGLVCYSAPVSTSSHAADSWIELLPNAGSLEQTSYALHELLGNIALQWR